MSDIVIDLTQAEIRLAEKIGKQAASKWGAVDADDAVAHLYLWLCENYKWVLEYRDGGAAKLTVAMKRAAAQFCAREHEAATGSKPGDQCYYSIDTLERVLPHVWDVLDRQQVSVDSHPITGQASRNGWTPGESDEALTIVTDIASGIRDLPKNDRLALYRRYVLGESYPETAAADEVTEDTARKRHDRAVSRLQSNLGGPPPTWDTHQHRAF
jgi:DNA-directed RNA polymerase specialized sigma24 family protein